MGSVLWKSVILAKNKGSKENIRNGKAYRSRQQRVESVWKPKNAIRPWDTKKLTSGICDHNCQVANLKGGFPLKI